MGRPDDMIASTRPRRPAAGREALRGRGPGIDAGVVRRVLRGLRGPWACGVGALAFEGLPIAG